VYIVTDLQTGLMSCTFTQWLVCSVFDVIWYMLPPCHVRKCYRQRAY